MQTCCFADVIVNLWPAWPACCPVFTAVFCFSQEYKRKQLEEQRQSERLQRQLQQEHAYLVSLQQQQQEKKPQLYHYNKNLEPNNKPTWAREVTVLSTFKACTSMKLPCRLTEQTLFHCHCYLRWRSEVSSTDRAHPRSAPLSLTLPSSHALTQSANQEWSSLLRPHRCRGLLNPKEGRARWVLTSV